MKKNYLTILLFAFVFLISQQGFSQSIENGTPLQDNIEGLSIYPNPVNVGKPYIHISSKHNLTKTIEIFNVLGKQIFSTKLIGKELNIADFNAGVYILKITENGVSETRKLVIK